MTEDKTVNETPDFGQQVGTDPVPNTKKKVETLLEPAIEDFGFVGFEVDENSKTADFVRFPVEEVYKAYKAGETKSPFHTAYIAGVEKRTLVKKDYELLPGVELESNTKPTVDQVTPESWRYSLQFHFVSPEGIYEHYHQFWDYAHDDPKAGNKKRTLSDGIGHFYNALVLKDEAKNVFTGPNYAKVLGRSPKNWGDVFEAVALIFNEGNGGTPVYHKEGKPFKVRIKLVFGQNGNIEMPYFGDKIERIIEGMPSRLQVKKDDKFVAPERPAGPVIGTPMSSASDDDYVSTHFG